VKVHSNDTTLAHALAKREVEKAVERLNNGLGLKILESKSVKEFVKRIDAVFHGRVIDASIGRVVGSRASAGVVVADSNDDGTLSLVQLVFDARKPPLYRVTPHAVPLVIQRHALARVIQRVTGESSLPKVVASIQPHLHAALLWVVKQNPMDPGMEVAVTGRGLEMAGAVDEHGYLRLKTAIDAISMQSPSRQAWAMGETVVVRITYDPPN
jgi:hypothetical protein